MRPDAAVRSAFYDPLEVARVITGKVALAGMPLELADTVHRCVAQIE